MEIAFKPLANNPQEIKRLLGLIKSDNLIHSSFTLKEHLPAVSFQKQADPRERG